MEKILDKLKEGTQVTLKDEMELLQALRHRNFYNTEERRKSIAKRWGGQKVIIRGTPEYGLHYFQTKEAGNFPFNAVKYSTNVY